MAFTRVCQGSHCYCNRFIQMCRKSWQWSLPGDAIKVWSVPEQSSQCSNEAPVHIAARRVNRWVQQNVCNSLETTAAATTTTTTVVVAIVIQRRAFTHTVQIHTRVSLRWRLSAVTSQIPARLTRRFHCHFSICA